MASLVWQSLVRDGTHASLLRLGLRTFFFNKEERLFPPSPLCDFASFTRRHPLWLANTLPFLSSTPFPTALHPSTLEQPLRLFVQHYDPFALEPKLASPERLELSLPSAIENEFEQ
jgi:hypothetical protein